MDITVESALAAAGIADRDGIQVLRDGFPSLVVRIISAAFHGQRSVILKACPHSSREPDVLLSLHRSGFPVPAVLDIREGDGFRVIVMEDVGSDALHKHPDAEWHKAAVREIAKIHRQSGLFRLPSDGSSDGSRAALMDLVPMRTDAEWAAIVRKGMEGTLRRIDDGTYGTFGTYGARGTCGPGATCRVDPERDREDLPGVLSDLAEKTLAMIRDPSPHRPFSHVLVHGDYHDGNVLIRTPKPREAATPLPPKPRAEQEAMKHTLERLLGGGAVTPPNPFAVVDWDSARWDSAFFDLVSLFDVGERMGTFHLDPEEIIQTYLNTYGGIYPDTSSDTRKSAHLLESPPDDLCVSCAKAEWRRCRLLRAWDELRWFAETGEDFGGRIGREIQIIRMHVGYRGWASSL